MPLARVFDGKKVVTTLHDVYLDKLSKWSDIQEYLPLLYETARSYDKVRVLELGTRKGNSTIAFLAAAEAVNGHVTSVDIERVTDTQQMRPLIGCPYWTFIPGSDTEKAVQAVLPVEVDVLFVDTSHEYEHTLSELYTYMPRLSDKGIALFHDTNIFMNLAGTEVSSPVPHHGETVPPVTQALDDYCAETGFTWQNIPGTYGLGVIHV